MKSFVNDDYYWKGREDRKAHLKPGMTPVMEVKPPTYYYHYSSEASQGALICQTAGFPAGYYKNREDHWSAYSDRIHSWDAKRFRDACEIVGTGDQGWAHKLPSLSEDKLKEFARVALNLPCTPTHVRCVHWFNVSNGYSCPTVEAIFPKEKPSQEDASSVK